MASTLPQFHTNTLTPVEIDQSSLEIILQSLQSAIRKGTQLLVDNTPASSAADRDDQPPGSIFTGNLGIALCLFRLHDQSNETYNHGESTPNVLAEARLRIDLKPRSLNLDPGRPSPITSPALGALITRAIDSRWHPDDPETLLSVTKVAISQSSTTLFRDHEIGVDEVLYGRTGLLWAILEIWKKRPDRETQSAFAAVFQMIHKLVTVILEAGQKGSIEYHEQSVQNDEANDIPLMWRWIDKFYSLGAMHGSAGILSILLDPVLPRHSIAISESYADIAKTISALCAICLRNGGHLPMSSPPWPSSRIHPLVQICHGAPGILTLLAAAKRNVAFASDYWDPRWDEAMHAASDVTWKQGLLGKGSSLCHGIGGNALALLLLADPLDQSTEGYMAAGLAMLMEAMKAPPFGAQETLYRNPDHPWSLYEGLAGLLCAWSEACVLIKVKLRIMQLQRDGVADHEELMRDDTVVKLNSRLLGFPCLVGGTVGVNLIPLN